MIGFDDQRESALEKKGEENKTKKKTPFFWGLISVKSRRGKVRKRKTYGPREFEWQSDGVSIGGVVLVGVDR